MGMQVNNHSPNCLTGLKPTGCVMDRALLAYTSEFSKNFQGLNICLAREQRYPDFWTGRDAMTTPASDRGRVKTSGFLVNRKIDLSNQAVFNFLDIGKDLPTHDFPGDLRFYTASARSRRREPGMTCQMSAVGRVIHTSLTSLLPPK